jgi:uncharacterized Fe-S cluster protein YjdI
MKLPVGAACFFKQAHTWHLSQHGERKKKPWIFEDCSVVNYVVACITVCPIFMPLAEKTMISHM